MWVVLKFEILVNTVLIFNINYSKFMKMFKKLKKKW